MITFRRPPGESTDENVVELARATEEEKHSKLERVQGFQERHTNEAAAAQEKLKKTAVSNENVYALLMDAA